MFRIWEWFSWSHQHVLSCRPSACSSFACILKPGHMERTDLFNPGSRLPSGCKCKYAFYRSSAAGCSGGGASVTERPHDGPLRCKWISVCGHPKALDTLMLVVSLKFSNHYAKNVPMDKTKAQAAQSICGWAGARSELLKLLNTQRPSQIREISFDPS